MPDATPGTAASCNPGGDGLTNCGPNADEDCCTSFVVPGGTFYPSYDGVTKGDVTWYSFDYTKPVFPATVSSFVLEKYEVTVGRFRRFVTAWNAGWRPAQGAGKHTHLNGGNGLAATTPDAGSGYEPGWDTSWASALPTDLGTWSDKAHLTSIGSDSWTPAVGANERRAIYSLTWYQAYAFCIWDGGFLPTEAEWNYAAAGGGGADGQRVFPWSSPSTSTSIDCTLANYSWWIAGQGLQSCAGSMTDVGSKSPKGNGKWGHADLAGNAPEWVLDLGSYPPNTYPSFSCTDCVVSTGSSRVFRGGSWQPSFGAKPDWSELTATFHAVFDADNPALGVRCARSP